MTDDRRVTRPPSFTPASSGGRPPTDDAIAVGSGSRASRPPQPGGQRPPTVAPATSSSRPSNSPSGGAAASPAATSPPATSRPAAPRTATSHRPEVRAAGAARAGTQPRPAQPGTGRPGTGQPADARADGDAAPARRRHPVRWVVVCLVLLLVLALAWPVGLVTWANGKVQHTAALSGAAGTPGTTYLIAGSDSRADGAVHDHTVGARTDSILLLHVPQHGPTALISIPRDSYVAIPGHGHNKINAAFAWGGAPLLVRTVEKLTGMTVDHYVQIGMAGVEDVVDAVGGVRLCYAKDVHDKDSKLTWKAGCHVVQGKKALAFSRMRKADPLGDIGRAERQRQVVGAVMKKVQPSSLAFHPSQQVALVDAATGVLTVDDDSDIVDLGRMALAFRAANGDGGVTGSPPLLSLNYRPGGVGSTVELDPDKTASFFAAIRDGKLPAGKVGGLE
ncbi:LCP family protein [Cellulomonas alba]|uniref:LCP family protein n=1 Tax=Cellulomonas alba TaxID=3053467 RepID=A0ABT7SCY7_9CELL|nr:LCP family protein [Cellulomonas alba]MDM7854043.1 LCP family protein [Cellulomonas alba]